MNFNRVAPAPKGSRAFINKTVFACRAIPPFACILAFLLTGCVRRIAEPARPRPVSIQFIDYHGWPDSILLDNGAVQAVVVPAIGRVMQFQFKDDSDGPFWENRDLDGGAPDPVSADWTNFGGDKTWPAPQSDWARITGRRWPPPPAFDSMPVASGISRGKIVLTSPVDPYFGIRTERRIELHPTQPEMTIITSFHKVEGTPVRVAVWSITQLDDPVLVAAPVPGNSMFPDGYNLQSETAPPSLTRDGDLLILHRNPEAAHKIGNDAGSLVWVGEKTMLRIDSPRGPGEHPDHGSSAEVYTNPNPLKYVELELLGPLQHLEPGDSISRTNRYTLARRRTHDPMMDARAFLGESAATQR